MKEPLSPIALPRDYGLLTDDNEYPALYTPGSYAIGEVLRMPLGELRQAIGEWSDYVRDRDSRGSYDPLFRWEGDYASVPCESEDSIINFRLIPGLTSEEGAMNLIRVGGEDAVKGGYIGDVIISGDVKSIADGRKSGTLARWKGGISRRGGKEFRNCQCPDFHYTWLKGVAKQCVHLSVMDQHAAEANGHDPRSVLPFVFSGDALLPPNLTQREIEGLRERPYLDQEGGASLGHLVIDVLLSRYVRGESLFEINKQLTRIPEVFSQRTVRRLREGGLTFNAIKQRFGKTGDEELGNDMLSVRKQLEKRLRNPPNGRVRFRSRRGVYAVEEKGGPYEALCPDWRLERGDINRPGELSVRPYFREDIPPLIIARREIPGSRPEPFAEEMPDERHPMARLHETSERLDDTTRKRTTFEFRIPRGLDIPDDLRSMYRARLDEHHPGSDADRRKLIEEHGLL